MNRYITGMMFLFIFTLLGCTSDNGGGSLNASFDVKSSDKGDNYKVFTNNSTGAYSVSKWDFGNGQSADNESSVEIHYPVKGDYTVTLDIWEGGQKSSASEQISIESTDSSVSFDITPDLNSPYRFKLENSSSSEASNFSWNVDRLGSIDDIDSVDIYCGLKGVYNVSLSAEIGGQQVIVEKSIVISEDDINYWSEAEISWEDNFDGEEIDQDSWTHETGMNGWGNNELQNYTDGENSVVSGGVLDITAKHIGSGQAVGDFTSSRLISKGKKSFKYGRIEIRAKIPADKGNGIWPAIWMLGESIETVGWPLCGEIDIMEYVSYNPNVVQSAIHNGSSSGNTVNTSGEIGLDSVEEEYHNYGVLWTDNDIRFYIDTIDNVTYIYAPSTKDENTWPFDKEQFILLNIAVGGNWGGAKGVDNAIFPATMSIDYIKVYQHNKNLK